MSHSFINKQTQERTIKEKAIIKSKPKHTKLTSKTNS